ncbi:cryptochrome/photolyase family protein [Patescibacteria group bacterium]|nr:cryptochrome/photolyase family protein [Patescibacteria group bacterium]
MEATIIYPHQLFDPKHHPALAHGRPVYLIEEPLFISECGTHRQKMLLHRLSLQAYKHDLEKSGYTVTYKELMPGSTTDTILQEIHKDGISVMHIVDTTDNYLERRITTIASRHGFSRVSYDSPLFILGKDDAISRFQDSGKFMKKFYERLRKDKAILMAGDKPLGGQWSFDSDNRAKLPKTIPLPTDLEWLENEEVTAAQQWLETIASEQYGETKVWIPYTRVAAKKFLADFLAYRFENFGTYEDAITTKHHRLFHSTLSPLINIGLLSPTEVLEKAIAYAEKNKTPLNSLEGFVRQILGWREFIRASYEVDGVSMRNQNFFNHNRTLPNTFWTGTTGTLPIDISIKTALTYGYNHHIERLMVLGNFMLLIQTNPHDVYRWFMSMYVDAYDWVMVPNIYGMSQFSDGGSFATKPYISGASYLQKMSDYPKSGTGGWEELWTALYWNFINTHSAFFSKNYRLSMMPKLLEKMSPDKKAMHLKIAHQFLSKK